MSGLTEELRKRAGRVLTAAREMDALHKAMYARDDPAGLAPDEDMKFRADGLCLGLADSAVMFAEFLLDQDEPSASDPRPDPRTHPEQ